MYKKIPVALLRPGMYVHELSGSWMDHSFWRTKFKIQNSTEIEEIVASGLSEIIIDTSKGLDVEQKKAAPPPATAADKPAQPPPPPPTPAPARVSVRDELKQAAKITTQAKKAVVSMFADVRMGKAVNAEALEPLVNEISDSVLRNPNALVSLARLKNKDDYTYMHSVAVCALMTSLARTMNLPEDKIRSIGLGGLLHDLGKAVIAPEILNKPGKLTDAEFDVIKTHPSEGHRMLIESRFPDKLALDVCLHHHEKVDGSGYPDKLKGDEISFFARMGAVCDVYDAVTSTRPYNNGWDPGETVRRMTSWKGHFDERILHAFIRCLGIYPIGALVRLDSGRIGVVIEQGEKSLLTPHVKAFYSTRSDGYIKPVIIDLERPGVQDKIVGVEERANWHFKNLDEIWMASTDE